MSNLSWLILILGWQIFTLYYMSSFFKWGVLTFASFFWIRYNVLLILVMPAFAGSSRNMDAVGMAIFGIREHIDQAFYLSILGIVFTVVGMALASLTSGNSLVFTFVEKGYAFWQTRMGAWISLIVLIVATLGIIAIGVRPFQGRQLSFEETSLRPAINLYTVVLRTLALSIIVYGFAQSRFFLVTGFLASMLGLLIGTRGASIEILFTFAICLVIAYRYRNLVAFGVYCVAFIMVAIVIGMLRSEGASADGAFADIGTVLSYQLLFGNNFSDFRDYAWILSGFSGQFYNGMTYLAGYMALVPTFISEFRYEYGIGRVTSTLAGLNPDFHGGLRPTMFGEAYLNFGIAGVVAIATFFGFYLGKIHMWVHRDLKPNAAGLLRVLCGFTAFTILLSIISTPGFYYVYIVIAWLTGGIVLSKLLQR